MIPGATSGLAIGRVRVVDLHADALRARLAADRLLSAAQPGVPGLPAGAILIVRRVAHGGTGPGTPLASPAALATWRTTVESKLVEIWHAAARPAHGPVPDTAPAVLFDDHAELLACLAADWAAGVVGARWWWQAVLRARSLAPQLSGGSGWLPVLLRSHADEVPAVFELLARRRLAFGVAVAISPREALALALAVAGEHAIRGAHELAVPPVSSVDAQRGEATPDRRSMSGSSSRDGRTADAPWRDFVTEAGGPGLDAGQRLLVGLALTIRRRPAVARATGFWRSVERWWRSAVTAPREDDSGSKSQAANGIRAHSRQPDGGGRPALELLRAAGREPQPPGAIQPTAAAVQRTEAASRPDDELGAAPSESPWSPAGDATSAETGAWTAHAGVFYLLNVALFLGLYGDFTTPRERGLALGPWDFVALIARRLLAHDMDGDSHTVDGASHTMDGDPRTVDGDPRTVDGDPIWGLLRELAGHEGRPGTGFRAPRCWRVPPDWLEPFDRSRGAWRWTVCDGRLRAVHPAGFVAIDLPVRGEPLAQLCGELVRYGNPRRVETARVGTITSRGLARWTDWVADYVRVRLRLALGTRSAAAAVRTVLERPGTVRVTPTRVDVEFSLDDLPVAIRLAGLDRSPGWIPAAGRHLAFHFA